MVENSVTLPFLRWPGGKRWLADELKRVFSEVSFERYLEPFLGGGSIFFALSPEKSILSDLNIHLINAYKQVKTCPQQVLKYLSEMPVSRNFYYEVRKEDDGDRAWLAARFIYLNRTSFNGIYRENQKGEFNVPWGGRNTTLITSTDLLYDCSVSLRRARIQACDFEETVRHATIGDLVYCDPPYTAKHNNGNFIRYNNKLFSWCDQERLASLAYEASDRGAHIFISNANNSAIASLYRRRRTKVTVVHRHSAIAAVRRHRGSTSEVIIEIPPKPRA